MRRHRPSEVMQCTQLVRGGAGIQIPIFWLNPVLFLIHSAARNNDLGTPLPPLVASKLSERLAYVLIVFEYAVLSIVPFAQEWFANLAGSHLIARIHATRLAENSKVQTAYGKEKAVMNRTTEHPSLKGTGKIR